MNFKNFWSVRSKLIKEKKYAEALNLETIWEDRLCNDVKFIIAHSWTLNSLKLFDKSLEYLLRIFESQPNNFEVLQRLLLQVVKNNNSLDVRSVEVIKMTGLVVKNLNFKNKVLRSKWIMNDFFLQFVSKKTLINSAYLSVLNTFLDLDWDLEPDWISNCGSPLPSGLVVDFSQFGKFYTGDPNHVVFKRLNRSVPWELHIAFLLKLLLLNIDEDFFAVDVGANIGSSTIPMAISSRGKVLSFEPVKSSFELLSKNIILNQLTNVELFNVALSDKPGLGVMYDVAPTNPGIAKLDVSQIGTTVVSTIDSLIYDRGIPVRLMKIDVEGHEELVCLGASRTIIRDKPVMIVEAFKGSKVFELLVSYGYRYMRIRAHDFIFVHSDHIYFTDNKMQPLDIY